MLSDAQRALLAARLRRGRAEAPAGIPRRADGSGPAPLSFGQEQLWFLDRFAPGMTTYNVPFGLRLTGPLDAGALSRALDAVVVRHEALRTRFVVDGEGTPRQVVDPPSGVALKTADLSGKDAATRSSLLGELATADDQPFDLAAGPLLRARLVRLAEGEHALLLVVHHIVFDGWSIGVLMRDLAALYRAESGGPAADLAELPVRFGDFAEWERGHLQGPALDGLVEHWRRTLDGHQTLNLPTDRPRPPVEDYRGGLEPVNLGAEALEGLNAFVADQSTTAAVVLLAASLALLHRYSGQDDIVVGTLSANRGRSELAPLVGYLVNTLPIRVDLSGEPTFAELLGRVRTATLDAFAHQDLPFAKLVGALDVDRDPSRGPVFQTVVSHAEAAGEVVDAGDVAFTALPPLAVPDTAKFDLGLFTQVRDGGLWIDASFASALFDRSTLRRMLGNFGVLLAGAIAEPGRRLSELPLLTESELRRELVEWNATATDMPRGSIHELFEAQVARTPDGLAAECGGESATYAELNAQANRIARWLRGFGVEREVLVGVGMAPSVRRLAVLVGILKAGGGYVPLDPALPAERLSYMMQDTMMPVVVADGAGAAVLPHSSAKVADLDAEWGQLSVFEAGNPGFPADDSAVAYVIYTSGSTGRPKGVVVEHRQVVNHALGMIRHWGFGPGDRVLQFASLNFDVSVMDMFTALLSGARAVVAPAETRLSPPRLAALVRDRGVTVAGLPPAVAGLLSGYEFPDLRFLMVAGEAVPAELARAWVRPGLRLVNGYGPTEDTVIATMAEIDGSVMPPPIGLPVPNAQAYVLDPRLRPVPVGVVGELYLGGAGVARGYLNAPELTDERFIPDPFAGVPGARLYKTGDLVRRLPDGRILFLGRGDGQVKVRGLRIELGEIEAVLAEQPSVAQAVVVVVSDATGEQHLVGFVRPEDSSVDLASVEQALSRRLPAYMVPGRLLSVAEFPLNPSGKVDRKALASLDAGPAPTAVCAEVPFVAPRTPTEAALVKAFGGLLGRDPVGIDESFFELGGNSLQAMQLVARIHRELAVDVPVTTVFLAPTPRRLGARIERDRGVAASAGPLVSLTDTTGGDEALFLVHAIGGTVFAYAPLAEQLADCVDVYGLEASGLAEGSSPATSLDGMTEAYLAAIRAARPAGPYRLAGWSLGALVAYELARRLEALGEEVGQLTLIDPPFALGATDVSDAQLAAQFVADAARTLGWPAEEVPGFDPSEPGGPGAEGDEPESGEVDPQGSERPEPLGWLARRLDLGSGAADAPPAPGSAAIPAATTVHGTDARALVERRFAVFRAHTHLIAGYRPRTPLAADTLVVSAAHSPNIAAQPEWAELLGARATLLTLDADHYSLLQPPLVQEIARRIRPGGQ